MKFKNEKHLAEFIKNLGGDLWLVGGAVRDKLMGITPHDKDFMITGINVTDIPFEKAAGHNFPVFLVKVGNKICEVAMARAEQKNGTGHKGFTFFTDASVTVEDDLARRDLTINAMARNVLTNELRNPFLGNLDLSYKVLRHTTEAFIEDPLRVFRVARFAAQFDFDVARETLILMEKLVPELNTLSPERVWNELWKVLDSRKPSRFFEVLKKCNALNTFFPEVAALDVPDKHDGTAFDHTMRVMDKGGEDETVRFGLLVHDFGKGKTPKELHPAHHGHDELGIDEVIAFCDRLRVPNDFKKFGILCCREHMRIKRSDEMRPGKFVKMVLTLGDNFVPVWYVSFIDSLYREGANPDDEVNRFVNIFELAKIVSAVSDDITGKTLIAEGFEPGEKLGNLLFQRRIKEFKKRRWEHEHC